MKKIKNPELLMPAGNYKKLITAFRFGADACYIGMPDFSLRYRENQISKKDIEKSINYAHKINKKIYITINTYPHNRSINKIIEHVKFLKKNKPDAIIFSDPGVFNLIKKYYPEAILHLSVQATCTNYETVRFWKKMGVSRIILARELSIKEIREIHKKIPDIELECFVHGAVCMAYSGRCLISNYLTGRDANQGDCAHSCRWNYKIKDYFLEENLRKNEFFPIYENKHGSHILSSRDLCMINNLKDIYKTGVMSFKIEGRAKNLNYIATIAKSYRKAIDDMILNNKFDKKLYDEVRSVSNRGFFTGFYFKKPSIKDHQLNANRTEGTYEFVGVVNKYNKSTKFAEIECKSQIKINDLVELLTPKKIYKFKINNLYNSNNKKIIIFNPGTKHLFKIKINAKIEIGDILRKNSSIC